jgi:hypothetical protein
MKKVYAFINGDHPLYTLRNNGKSCEHFCIFSTVEKAYKHYYDMFAEFYEPYQDEIDFEWCKNIWNLTSDDEFIDCKKSSELSDKVLKEFYKKHSGGEKYIFEISLDEY